ncbi:MAG: 2-amino-4-hydroxy-6-hydroxymethyldihydropteridine diphosphokinase [Proteobacteria bacterium]|nr:2-amino-4-hydroxy-6-hydroxymethyldihydropteridine diphosphokinase [Pseudomonadota bacterium]
MDAWIGLGSNLGNPGVQLQEALAQLEHTAGIELRKISGFYRTAPWGKLDQDDFLNAVAVVETELQAGELLDVLLQIEQQMGRDRSTGRWGPRCIDLDLLSYDDLVMKSPRLEIPHPRMHLRAFVLRPLLELDPDFMIAGKRSAKECLSALDDQDIEYIGSFNEQ